MSSVVTGGGADLGCCGHTHIMLIFGYAHARTSRGKFKANSYKAAQSDMDSASAESELSIEVLRNAAGQLDCHQEKRKLQDSSLVSDGVFGTPILVNQQNRAGTLLETHFDSLLVVSKFHTEFSYITNLL